jgi:hypothetical protein
MFVIYCEELQSLHHPTDAIGSFRYLDRRVMKLQAGSKCKHGVVTYKVAGSLQSLKGKINMFFAL